MQTIRLCFDRLMRAGIKFFTLTGVAVTVTACYGPPPDRYRNDPAYQTDTQNVKQQLEVEAEELSE
jgi:hypothetical protein